MEKKASLTVKVYFILYIVAALIIAAYILLRTDVRERGYAQNAHDFTDSWQMETGELVSLNDVNTKKLGGSVLLEKRLPDDLAPMEDFCFQTQNVNLTVWVNGREAYRFEARENLTGFGYGVMFHNVELFPSDAGQNMSILLENSLDAESNGYIRRAYICPSVDYTRLLIEERLLPGTLSLLVIFFGILLLTVYFWVPDKSVMPYDIVAFGAAATMAGLWCLNDTEVLSLLTGHIYVYRVLDKLLLYLVGYPFVCFINSLTKLKRPVYRHAAFWVSGCGVIVLLGLRYGRGADMIHLYFPAFIAYATAINLLVFAILLDNARYCRKHGMRIGLSRFYLALGVLMGCAGIDVLIYTTNLTTSSMHGVFMRFGMVFFVVLMLLQFLHWWAIERTSLERDRFVNRALQYAVSANSPEENINALLEYLGVEMHAKRTYIFEDGNDGTYRGTYEWFADGLAPRSPELLTLPYDGLIDALYEVFRRSNRLIVEDAEACRSLNATLYEILKANHVKRMVVGPLEANGKLIGLFGVDDAPREHLMEISEIIRLISYFFTQLILQREEQAQLTRYSYFDPLAGAHNRRAFGEFLENGLDACGTYGYVMCDINGLKAVNDSLGHEAGDAMIVHVAKSLMKVFGDENVYRMGGDEFAAFDFAPDEASFAANVRRAKELIAENGHSASVGAVYCANGALAPAEVQSEADARMYSEKEAYYQGRNDRRR